MALDLSALRSKLNELTKKAKQEDTVWKPAEGETVIRIVPLESDPNNPFIERYFHYLGRKTYLSPVSFGERDPIEEFGKNLRSAGGLSKEEWAKTKEFIPKMRTFAAIVVRGKENEGIKFWGFGKTTYTELLSIIADPDYDDITSVSAGHDIKVTFTPKEKSSTGFPQTSIRIAPKKTPLTSNADLLKTLLKNQPKLDDVYQKLSYDELSQVLENYLNPKASNAPSNSQPALSTAQVSTDTSWEEPTEKVSSEKKTTKISDDFEDIFNNN